MCAISQLKTAREPRPHAVLLHSAENRRQRTTNGDMTTDVIMKSIFAYQKTVHVTVRVTIIWYNEVVNREWGLRILA